LARSSIDLPSIPMSTGVSSLLFRGLARSCLPASHVRPSARSDQVTRILPTPQDTLSSSKGEQARAVLQRLDPRIHLCPRLLTQRRCIRPLHRAIQILDTDL